MRLKIIALLVVAILLVVASSVGAMGLISSPTLPVPCAEDESGDYWWEDCSLDLLPPFARRLVVEAVVLIFDRYFGVDVSRMSSREMDELGSLIGLEGIERYYQLVKEYARRMGFEEWVDELPERQYLEQYLQPSLAPPVEKLYWWEMAANPEELVEAIIDQIAEAKGMCPSEVAARFEELFPGVALWSMTCYEFDNFLKFNSLSRPPIRPDCFDEQRHNGGIIDVYGRVPVFSTEQEMTEFNEKLNKVILEVYPLLQESPGDAGGEPLLITMRVFRGTILVCTDQWGVERLRREKEVYEIIAERAESLFGIEDIRVTFFIPAYFELLIGYCEEIASR